MTDLVPATARTRGFALIGTGTSVSGSAAGALAGVLIESAGAQTALTVAVMSGPAACIIAMLGRRLTNQTNVDARTHPKAQNMPLARALAVRQPQLAQAAATAQK